MHQLSRPGQAPPEDLGWKGGEWYVRSLSLDHRLQMGKVISWGIGRWMEDEPAKITQDCIHSCQIYNFSTTSESPSSVNDFALFFRDKLGGTKWDISLCHHSFLSPIYFSTHLFFPVIISAIKAISSTWAHWISFYPFTHLSSAHLIVHISSITLFSPWYKKRKNKLKTSLISISLPAIVLFSQHLSSRQTLFFSTH